MDPAAPSQDLPIEKRVATLEQQMAQILRSHDAAAKDWIATAGTWQDHAFSREADELGEAWRKSESD